MGQLGAFVLTWSAHVPLSWPLLISTGRHTFSKPSCAFSLRPLLSFLNFSPPEFSFCVWRDLFFSLIYTKASVYGCRMNLSVLTPPRLLYQSGFFREETRNWLMQSQALENLKSVELADRLETQAGAAPAVLR